MDIIMFPKLCAASERRPERAPTVADGAGPDSRLVNAPRPATDPVRPHLFTCTSSAFSISQRAPWRPPSGP